MGVVNVVSQRAGHFTPERVDLLTAIVDGLGALLENVNLYQQVNAELEQRKKAEEALRETETRFGDLVEGSSDNFVGDRPNRRLHLLQFQRGAHIEYAPSEVVGHTPFEFMPPEERVRMSEYIAAKATAGEPFDVVEHQVVYKDWSIGYMECSGKPMFDDSGQVIGYRGVDRNITARKSEERELRAVEVRALAPSKLAPSAR